MHQTERFKESVLRFVSNLHINGIDYNFYFGCEQQQQQNDEMTMTMMPETLQRQLTNINIVIDSLFSPDVLLNSKDLNDVDTLKLYLTGSMPYNTFTDKIKEYDASTVCGLVWNTNYVAYRCRTCARSPCMSICGDCFRHGNHNGHDYNMFRSNAGGACDCGDECVMSPSGFCAQHGHQARQHTALPPDELIKCCEIIVSSLLYRLLQSFRFSHVKLENKEDAAVNKVSTMASLVDEMQAYFTLLNDLCNMGSPMRKCLADYMLDEQFYRQKSKSCKSASFEIYEKASSNQKRIKWPKQFVEKQFDPQSLNMIDEFLFWCIYFEFPECLVTFMLNLLPVAQYKLHFIKAFVAQYANITLKLLDAHSEQLASRVVHISVQLFSNEAIVLSVLDETHLLQVVTSSLYNMIMTTATIKEEKKQETIEKEEEEEEEASFDPHRELLVKSEMENAANNRHMVVDADHRILQENLYWLIVSDLVNLLSHRRVCLKFLQSEPLVELWLDLVKCFQGMNLNKRKFGDHVQLEQPTYFSSFSAELEFCSSIMWSFLQHLQPADDEEEGGGSSSSNEEKAEICRRVLTIVWQKLISWLQDINYYSNDDDESEIKRPNGRQLTFHLPLHRYFSTFFYTLCKLDSSKKSNLFYLTNNHQHHHLLDVLTHPLQTQIGYHEIHANMWVRNGLQMKAQAMTYVQNHFCTSFSDADLHLIQIVGALLDRNVFMQAYMERFHLAAWLSDLIKERRRLGRCDKSDKNEVENVVESMLMETTEVNSNNSRQASALLPKLEAAHQSAMLVGALTLLAQLVTVKANLQLKSSSENNAAAKRKSKRTRSEIVSLLCINDRTYSQLEESLPDVCGLSGAKKDIQFILSDVADYLQPTLDYYASSSSISNVKQGIYKPKASVWLNEYDPLYVTLRSVKVREFQESFDRYCQFIHHKMNNNDTKSSIDWQTKVKNLWPPFRLPRRLNDDDDDDDEEEEVEVDKIANILNSKYLHCVLLNVLFEYYYCDSMSERIVYFTIYLLELAINASKNTKSTERKAKKNLFKEFYDIDVEFESDEIVENLFQVIAFEMAPSHSNVAKVKSSSEAMIVNDALKEQHHHFKSGEQQQQVKLTSPPLKKICSGVAFLNTQETTTTDSMTQPNIEHDDDDESATTSKKEADNTFTIYDSILSLLIKLYIRNEKLLIFNCASTTTTTAEQPKEDDNNEETLRDHFKFLNGQEKMKEEDEGMFKEHRIGDENDFLLNIIQLAAANNAKCRQHIEKIVDEIVRIKEDRRSSSPPPSRLQSPPNPTTPNNKMVDVEEGKTKSDDFKNKKLKAKARQEKLLNQMLSSQRAFLSNPSNKVDIEVLNKDKEMVITMKSPPPPVLAAAAASPIQIDDEEEKKEETSSNCFRNQEAYDCCICCVSLAQSTPDRPMCVIMLLQATSVLAHRESKRPRRCRPRGHSNKLLLSEDEEENDENDDDETCFRQEEKRMRNLRDVFAIDSCKYSINLGWLGGIYAQMCGHYLHFDCYQSYKQSIDVEQQATSGSGRTNEFTCPLCRQLANCVLPILPSIDSLNVNSNAATTTDESMMTPQTSAKASLVPTPGRLWILSSIANKNVEMMPLSTENNDLNHCIEDLEENNEIITIYDQIARLLKTRTFTLDAFKSCKTLAQCKNDVLATLTQITPIEFRYIDRMLSLSSSYGARVANYSLNNSSIDDDIAMFIMSVLRTQLEIDVMLKQLNREQQTDNAMMSGFKRKRACFLPLFDVIATHCRLLCHESRVHVKQWLQLTKTTTMTTTKKPTNEQEDSSKRDAVPVLIKDPLAILLLLVVNLPTIFDRDTFDHIVASVFNLVYVQSVLLLCRDFDSDERLNWSKTTSEDDDSSSSSGRNGILFKDLIAQLINSINFSTMTTTRTVNENNNATAAFIQQTIWTIESAKNYVETKCMSFLNVAALLKSYLFDCGQQSNNASTAEIMLNNNSFESLMAFLNLAEKNNKYYLIDLKWPIRAKTLIDEWITEFTRAYAIYPVHINNILNVSLTQYDYPQLLELPNLYSDLFAYYSTKKCKFCGKVPKETSICLICGTQVGYKAHACCDEMKEFNKKHLTQCGAGTLIFLNVNSTIILIVRSKRCSPWASLYLDEHEEEDRDLRRGKPLYLNRQRYNLLKAIWRHHGFDYQNLKWYNGLF